MIASMQQQRDQQPGEPRRTCIQDNEPVRNLLTDDVASSSVTRQFWSRRGEWCHGSLMLVDTAEPPRQACPVCGKIVRVHLNRRLNAHFPTRDGAASAVPTVRAAP
jgi:hypothetical protein